MKNQTKLYNVILPIWLLWLFPQVWVVSLSLSLAIDCLVLYLTLRAMKHTAKGEVMKTLWWKFWLLGWLADLVGVAWMFLSVVLIWVAQAGRVGDSPAWTETWENTLGHIMHNPFAHPAAFVWTLMAVAIAGVCVYFFDKRAMKKCALLTDPEKHKIALAMAIVTAPWLFFIPMY